MHSGYPWYDEDRLLKVRIETHVVILILKGYAIFWPGFNFFRDIAESFELWEMSVVSEKTVQFEVAA